MNVLTKISAIFLISSVASCTTVPPDPWTDLETETEAAVTPLDCGSFPFPADFNDEVVTYDKAGTNDLNDYRKCAQANHDIAEQHALQINQLKIARAALVDAGGAQRRIADMRQQALTDERQHNLWTTWGLYAVILAMGFAL